MSVHWISADHDVFTIYKSDGDDQMSLNMWKNWSVDQNVIKILGTIIKMFLKKLSRVIRPDCENQM
jgi:hypothetical protein